MRQISKHTQIKPPVRTLKQLQLAEQLDSDTENTLRIDLESNVIDDALLFRPPKITMKREFVPTGSGVFNIKEQLFQRNATLGTWGIISLNRDMEIAKKMAMNILKVSSDLGVHVNRPKLFQINSGDKSVSLSA